MIRRLQFIIHGTPKALSDWAVGGSLQEGQDKSRQIHSGRRISIGKGEVKAQPDIPGYSLVPLAMANRFGVCI